MNSKGKGNKFERDVASALSFWLTEGEETRACWRSDTSGAAATIWAKKNKEARYVQANAGDIRKIAEKGLYPKLDAFFDKYVVECKHYKLVDFYPPYNATLVKFFEACIAERKSTGKKPILIIKGNNRKILFCEEGVNPRPELQSYFTLYYKDLTLTVYLFDDVVKQLNGNDSSGEGDRKNKDANSSQI